MRVHSGRFQLPAITAMTAMAFLLVPGIPTVAKDTAKMPPTAAPGKIVVDGQFDDWLGVPTNYFKDQNAVVGVCIDKDHLYIHFRIRDAQYARTIKMFGLTVYVDPKGKSKKDFYVKYTDGPDMANMRPKRNPEDTSGGDRQFNPENREGMRPPEGKMADSSMRFICYQKDVIVEKPIPLDGSEGPAVASGVWEGFYCYEFSIPLAESKVRHYGPGIKEGTKYSVGFIWGDMGEMRENMRGGPPGGGSGGGPGGGGGMPGGGGPPGGGMRGGPPGGGGDRPDMPKEQEVWVKTEYAKPAPPAEAVPQTKNE